MEIHTVHHFKSPASHTDPLLSNEPFGFSFLLEALRCRPPVKKLRSSEMVIKSTSEKPKWFLPNHESQALAFLSTKGGWFGTNIFWHKVLYKTNRIGPETRRKIQYKMKLKKCSDLSVLIFPKNARVVVQEFLHVSTKSLVCFQSFPWTSNESRGKLMEIWVAKMAFYRPQIWVGQLEGTPSFWAST